VKYIALDLGNVVCNVNFDPFIKSLSKTLNVYVEDINYFLNRSQKLHDLGLTVIADELKDHFKIKSPVIIEELALEWQKTVKGNPVMISIIKELINNKINIALLSNIGIDHSSIMRNILTADIYDNSIKFFSCEVGARKPSKLYYKTFIDMYPEFRCCAYLDDRIENVNAGKSFGFNAQHFVLDSLGSEKEIANKFNEIKLLCDIY
jgi:FMN phosphatase YigB (HAD superfamily)